MTSTSFLSEGGWEEGDQVRVRVCVEVCVCVHSQFLDLEQLHFIFYSIRKSHSQAGFSIGFALLLQTKEEQSFFLKHCMDAGQVGWKLSKSRS